MKTIVACLLLSLTGYCSAVAICTLEYNPRCGVDGKIYGNLCFLRGANVEEADSFEVCQQKHQTACLAIFLPVCGQDGKVYSNDCVMRVAGVEQAESFEACRGHPELCPEVCTMEYVPVCGSDGKIYGNKCEMKARNCGKLMFTRPMSECEAQSAPVGPKCPKIYFPTCGVDGKVYDNDCLRSFAEVEEAESFETCRSANHPLCPAICTMEYAPVCGSDGNIYATECVMRSQNCGKRLYVKEMEECQ